LAIRLDALHLGLPAAGVATEVQHRADHVLLQAAVDLPHELLALLLVGLHRLLVDQLVDLLVAVVHVGARAAHVALVELLVGLVDAVARPG